MTTHFAIQPGYQGRESIAIHTASYSLGAKVSTEREPKPGQIPIGSVEYCEPLFGPHHRDFYPHFLQDHLHRNLYLSSGHFHLPRDFFAKDASAWKSNHEPATQKAGYYLPAGEFYLSDPVSFTQEWRYYVAAGQVVTTGWYRGNDEDEPAPDLAHIHWPDRFSAAVDFGRLDTGEIALVECHAPFACGWYGENHLDYARWQIEAWLNRGWWLNYVGGWHWSNHPAPAKEMHLHMHLHNAPPE